MAGLSGGVINGTLVITRDCLDADLDRSHWSQQPVEITSENDGLTRRFVVVDREIATRGIGFIYRYYAKEIA